MNTSRSSTASSTTDDHRRSFLVSQQEKSNHHHHYFSSSYYNNPDSSGASPSLLSSSPPVTSCISSSSGSSGCTKGSTNGGGDININININNPFLRIHKPSSGGTTPSSGGDGGIDYAGLVKEMNELSVEERERVFDDIHGVGEIQDETIEFVTKCITELDQILIKMPTTKKGKNYSRAIFLCPNLLNNDQEFKLMFLRADEFNTQQAANRICRYYDFKFEYFGYTKLVKRITIDDLSSQDLEVIKSGQLVILPMKDQIGRPILFDDHTKNSNLNKINISIDSLFRIYFYIVSVAMREDVTAQRKGICTIVNSNRKGSEFFLNVPQHQQIELIKKTGYMTTCLPCRFTNYQICHNDPKTEFFVSLLRTTIQRHTRLRLRTHFGSPVEQDYFLMSLGTKTQQLIQNASNGILTIHEEYIERRKVIDRQQDLLDERQEIKSKLALYPKQNDVVIGRGVPYQKLPGNIRWTNMIHNEIDKYADSTTTSFEKTVITMQLVKKIKDMNGRFLQQQQQQQQSTSTTTGTGTGTVVVGWQILDDSDARLKAASAFRTRMRPTSSSNSNKKRQRLG